MKSLSPMYAASLGLTARVRMMPRVTHLGLYAFLIVICTTCAFAQEATIVGTVTDPSGAAVPNAKITLTNSETGISRVISSGTTGSMSPRTCTLDTTT